MNRLLPACVLLIVAAGLWLLLREPAVPPAVEDLPSNEAAATGASPDPKVAASTETVESTPADDRAAAADAPHALHRRNVVEEGSPPSGRRFTVIVDPSRSAPVQVPVELLFGTRDALRDQVLLAAKRRKYRAAWPMGAEAELPWAVDFAFPTAGRSLERVAPSQDRVRLRMPPTAELLLALVEQDDVECRESADAEIRVVGAEWPAGRWRRLPFRRGTASVVAELGLTVEVRGKTSSGRSFESMVSTGVSDREGIRHRIRLSRGGRIEFELTGLPVREEDQKQRWRVDVFGFGQDTAFRPRRIEREGLHFELFGNADLLRERPRLLVIATEPNPRDGIHWGVLAEDARRVRMKRCEVVAEGRVIADSYGWVGPSVELRMVGSDRAIHRVMSDGGGRFQMLGPDPRAVAMVAMLSHRGERARERVPLPHPGPIELHVR